MGEPTITIPVPDQQGRYEDGARWSEWDRWRRPDGVRLEYYDANDHVAARAWHAGAHPDGVIAEEYDASGRVTRRVWCDGRTETYTYPEPTDG